MSSQRASGTFTVKMQPTPDGVSRFLRLQLDKVFEGGLVGTSEVEMLASNAGDQPSGGYVALERVSGTLDGHRGTFVLQHSGTMAPGEMHIDVLVTPGSGTGDLTGLQGHLTIRAEERVHHYELEYTLPR